MTYNVALESIKFYLVFLIYFVSDDDTGYVAFTAVATKDRENEIGDIVMFDSAISNIGDFYNTDTSSFICPFDGVFSFSTSFYSGIEHNVYIAIMLDSFEVIRGYVPYSENEYTHGNSTIVMECKAFERVWTKCVSGDALVFSEGSIKSHFTGFALDRYQ